MPTLNMRHLAIVVVLDLRRLVMLAINLGHLVVFRLHMWHIVIHRGCSKGHFVMVPLDIGHLVIVLSLMNAVCFSVRGFSARGFSVRGFSFSLGVRLVVILGISLVFSMGRFDLVGAVFQIVHMLSMMSVMFGVERLMWLLLVMSLFLMLPWFVLLVMIVVGIEIILTASIPCDGEDFGSQVPSHDLVDGFVSLAVLVDGLMMRGVFDGGHWRGFHLLVLITVMVLVPK